MRPEESRARGEQGWRGQRLVPGPREEPRPVYLREGGCPVPTRVLPPADPSQPAWRPRGPGQRAARPAGTDGSSLLAPASAPGQSRERWATAHTTGAHRAAPASPPGATVVSGSRNPLDSRALVGATRPGATCRPTAHARDLGSEGRSQRLRPDAPAAQTPRGQAPRSPPQGARVRRRRPARRPGC